VAAVDGVDLLAVESEPERRPESPGDGHTGHAEHPHQQVARLTAEAVELLLNRIAGAADLLGRDVPDVDRPDAPFAPGGESAGLRQLADSLRRETQHAGGFGGVDAGAGLAAHGPTVATHNKTSKRLCSPSCERFGRLPRGVGVHTPHPRTLRRAKNAGVAVLPLSAGRDSR